MDIVNDSLMNVNLKRREWSVNHMTQQMHRFKVHLKLWQPQPCIFSYISINQQNI